MQLFKRKKNNWISFTTSEQLDSILNNQTGITYIFKHSTRCGISSMAKSRLESIEFEADRFYYLDLLTYRSLSNAVALKIGIEHQSPQLIIIKEGQAIAHFSHNGISAQNIEGVLEAI